MHRVGFSWPGAGLAVWGASGPPRPASAGDQTAVTSWEPGASSAGSGWAVLTDGGVEIGDGVREGDDAKQQEPQNNPGCVKLNGGGGIGMRRTFPEFGSPILSAHPRIHAPTRLLSPTKHEGHRLLVAGFSRAFTSRLKKKKKAILVTR